MSSNLQALDDFPSFTGEESPQEQIRQLQNYLFVVAEQLKYTMRNLGVDNLNPKQWDAMKEETLKGQTQQDVFNKLFDGGKVQGFEIVDGKLYINGEFAVIYNLIANSVIAGILQSKDGGVYIDLDEGVGNLARGTSVYLSTWDDYMMGWTKSIDEVMVEFLTAELERMKFNTIRDFAAKLENNGDYPEAAKLSIYKFRGNSGAPFASISFEWSDGTRSHKTATETVDGWEISEMVWL